MPIHLKSLAEAHDLLKTRSAEEIRQLWENGAFEGNAEALKEYLFKRILYGEDLELPNEEC